MMQENDSSVKLCANCINRDKFGVCQNYFGLGQSVPVLVTGACSWWGRKKAEMGENALKGEKKDIVKYSKLGEDETMLVANMRGNHNVVCVKCNAGIPTQATIWTECNRASEYSETKHEMRDAIKYCPMCGRKIVRTSEEQDSKKKLFISCPMRGRSPSGHCGSAAYCGKGHPCCAGCNEDCNMRCGWYDEEQNEEEKGAAKMLKEGEKVFATNGAEVYTLTITKIFYDTADGGIMFDSDAIGTSIFLTQADAEKERDRIFAGFSEIKGYNALAMERVAVLGDG